MDTPGFYRQFWTVLLVCILTFSNCNAINSKRDESIEPDDVSTDSASPSTSNTIKGKINTPGKKPTPEWLSLTQVVVNGGEYIGFVKEDGSFVITGVPGGSHTVEVLHPQFYYESARVDITSRGKIRARKVNHLQPALVSQMAYPLRLTATGAYKYFQTREQWRITDVLMSPMVLMMVLPLILIVILPKMMSDPETRREMEQVTLPKYEMPEMSEMLTSFFGGGKESGGGDHDRRSVKPARAKKNN